MNQPSSTPQNSSSSISVIVVNWNAGYLLKKCVECILNQSVRPEQILIIDNASTDESISTIKNIAHVDIIQLQENVGFAKANNIAFSKICTEYVALLNPDAFPESDWLEQLLSSAKKHPDAASIGSMQTKDDTEIIDGIGDCYHISGLMWRNRHGKRIRPTDLQEKEIFSPCAAAALYRMDALRKVGLFEESFFCYCEDVDLGFRLRLAGYSSWYAPKAKVTHIGSATSGGAKSDFAVYYGHRNMMWVYWRNMPMLIVIFTLPLHILTNLIIVIIYSLQGRSSLITKAKLDGVLKLPQIISKRKEIQRKRKCSLFSLIKYINSLRI